MKWLVRVLLAAAALFVLAQVVPYGRNHTNPPVLAEPSWDSAQTRRLAREACFDCHSNVTAWPWYTNVAPVSWLTYSDVTGGRAALNFSEWNRPQDGAGDVVEAVQSGSMPPWFYTPLHPSANLSASERDALARGLSATLRRSPPR
ncbi:MAG TPA: heme-binding domain-containing protein [Gaiellaceae bacterium]